MNRTDWEHYIAETYNADSDRPWRSYPDYLVFRHSTNQKWFALLMRIPRVKLGLQGEGEIEVMNLKCDPRLTGVLRAEPGFFPAYHMNKESWITAALDGSADEEKVRLLLDQSFAQTDVKPRRRKAHSDESGE